MIQLKKTILTLVALLAVTLFTGLSASAQNLTLKLSDALYDNDNYTFYAYSDGDKSIAEGTYVQINMSTYHTQVMNIYMNGEVVYTKPSGAVYTNDVYHFTAGPNCKILGGNSNRFDWNSNPNIRITMDAPASSATPVDGFVWNGETKTGTFKMPGGNVTLEPEYYPQAALTAAPTAINDVPATTDGAILKAGTVATIGTTEQAQGTVMYYVSPTALDDAALLALAADQWTADVPTAEKLTKGQAYVYYYVRGNDSDTDDETFSDGDILSANALTVTIAAEPTYTVEFAEGTPESDKWKAEPAAGVTKGQPVTVTYTGSKKVLGVKAEKKAAEPVADIIWDGTNVTDLNVPGTESYTKEGVTLRANAHMIQAQWYNFGDPLVDGIGFNANEPGGFTFTAPTGKKFTKIEMTLTGSGDWEIAYGYGKLGTGWAFNADMVKEILTVTWTGSAASTVDLLKDTDDFSGANVKSIAFYLSK